MNKKDEALKLAQDLRTLADRFSEGWHDGIKIDASEIMLLTDAAATLAEQPAQQESVNKYCCHLCFNKSGQVFLDRMILCPKCGNKRCPKATHHGLPCTKSNDLGQKGSIYDQPLQQEPVAWRYLTQYDNQSVWTYCANEPANRETRQPLYTSPPAQRKPLTDEELRVIENKINPNMRWRSSDEEGITFYPIEYYELVRTIEAAHGITGEMK